MPTNQLMQPPPHWDKLAARLVLDDIIFHLSRYNEADESDKNGIAQDLALILMDNCFARGWAYQPNTGWQKAEARDA